MVFVVCRSQLTAAENGLKAVQKEVTVAIEEKEAAESKVAQLEREMYQRVKRASELEQLLELERQRKTREKEELQQANTDRGLLALEGARSDAEIKRRHEDELKALTVMQTAEIDEIKKQLEEKTLYCMQLEQQVEQVTSTFDDMKVAEAETQQVRWT